MAYEDRIIRMRKEGNSYLITILQEALSWNLMIDEIVVLCDILRIFYENMLEVSRNEIRTAFNRHYQKKEHGDKKSYLAWIYKEFNIKQETRTFPPQVRKNISLPQTTEGINKQHIENILHPLIN